MGTTDVLYDDTRVKCIKLQRADCGDNRYCIFRFDEGGLLGIQEEIDTSEIGDKLIIEIIEMTISDVENLPEFEGW